MLPLDVVNMRVEEALLHCSVRKTWAVTGRGTCLWHIYMCAKQQAVQQALHVCCSISLMCKVQSRLRCMKEQLVGPFAMLLLQAWPLDSGWVRECAKKSNRQGPV